MAKTRKTSSGSDGIADSFAADLISSLNKQSGARIAYNLATDLSPTHIKRWVSTGSLYLDYIIANRRDGGYPEGRIIEIFGPPSIGKSHIATHLARSTQLLGGIVVYMDTENATQIENLHALGVDVSKRFVFCEPATVEEVFQVAERTIKKVKEMSKEIPVTIIWDSVAASPPKAELEADYDKDLVGTKARAISKGMRKITQLIGNENITFVCLNQTRVAIGQMFGDPTTVPGGKAIPFHASVRIKLGAGKPIQDSDGRAIGINVSAKTVKNKVGYPFRTARFQIHFGKGIVEHEELFDMLREHCEKRTKDGRGELRIGDLQVNVHGKSSWKHIDLTNAQTGEVVREKKFYKKDFGKLLRDTEWTEYLFALLDDALIIRRDDDATGVMDIDHESLTEVQAVADMLNESGPDPTEELSV